MCAQLCAHETKSYFHKGLKGNWHSQLPALARLDLRLMLIKEVADAELEDSMRTLGTLSSLRAFALEVGPTRGLLRHLRLPPGLTVNSLCQPKINNIRMEAGFCPSLET